MLNRIIYAGSFRETDDLPTGTGPVWNVIFCISGSGEVLYDKTVLPVSAGDILIIPPSAAAGVSGDAELCRLGIEQLSPEIDQVLVLKDSDNERVLGLFTAARAFFTEPSRCSGIMLSALGQAIAAYLSALYAPGAQSSIVRDIERSILEHYTDADFDLAALLHSLPFSCDHLTKLFKRELGTTPHQYLTDKRLNAAMERLSTRGGSNIAEIAHTCGFKDPLYFSRRFRKKFGVSPSFCREDRDHTLSDETGV